MRASVLARRASIPLLALLLIALPFTWTMDVLTDGAFGMSGDETFKVGIAALFCCALVYAAGAAIEWASRALWRLGTSRLSGADRQIGDSSR